MVNNAKAPEGQPRDENAIERYLGNGFGKKNSIPDSAGEAVTIPALTSPAGYRETTIHERQIAEATERGWPIQETR